MFGLLAVYYLTYITISKFILIEASTHIALLAATLRTYQRAGCDSEQLSLSCPRGTSISIELAQYGRAGDLSDHSLCPPISQEDLTTTGTASDGVIHSGTEIEVKPPETCTVSGLQYALLQTVVVTCQKKRHCKFSASQKTLSNGDPCSGIRKFVEIAYKCRPYEFRSKVACENDNMPLVCNPYSRIAIYSASFGHIERESVQCGQGNTPDNSMDNNSRQTCQASYATETVMQICHGRRRCSITADAGTFGRPCKNDVRMYLKVVYTCMPRKVLKDRYETAPEADEPQQSELDMDQDELYDEDQFYKESEAIPPAPKLQGAIPNPAFPFDFNTASDGATSTIIPPLLSRNDNSLDVRKPASANNWQYKRPDHYMIQETTTDPVNDISTTTFVATSNDVSTMAAIIDNNPMRKRWRNFFYRRKCEMEDDWGPIGLNCTEEDLITERIEVIGFISNWIETYDHIKKNQEQFYLYLIISVVSGVLLCLTLVIGRLTLHRRNQCHKNNNSSSGRKNSCKGTSNDTITNEGDNSKFHQVVSGETQLPGSFGDDISDIDADIDLTSPMPVPSLSSRNETYMTYAPTPNCTYGTLPPPPSSANLAAATTMLMPTSAAASLHSSLLISGHGAPSGAKPLSIDALGGVAGGGGRQHTPPPPGAYMGICSPTVSGTMTMGPHLLAPSALSSVSHSSAGAVPSYLSGAIMVPGHHHGHVAGTLRRTLIPTSMGMLSTTTQQPSGSAAVYSHAMAGALPSNSGIYYDSTVPRNLNRGMSADNAQYFYG